MSPDVQAALEARDRQLDMIVLALAALTDRVSSVVRIAELQIELEAVKFAGAKQELRQVLEDRFPWLQEPDTQASGGDTVDTLIEIYRDACQQPGKDGQ